VYFDQISDAAKVEARRKIADGLDRGFKVYELGVGDEIEIFFRIERKPTSKEYVVSVADKLRIESLNDPENSRTVQVRPDGRISLPLIGPVTAAGQTADALARQLQERYSSVLTAPQITVLVTESHSPLDDFIDMIGPPSKGRSIVLKVLPDGTVTLPLLPPLQATGRTVPNLQNEIDVKYSALGLDVSVSLIPRVRRAGAAVVIGEVGKPGRIEFERPATVLMAVGQAVLSDGLELSPNFGDGLKDQAAAWARGAAELPTTSIPSVNLTPWISFGRGLLRRRRRPVIAHGGEERRQIPSADQSLRSSRSLASAGMWRIRKCLHS